MCNSCNILYINGVKCHETGCPESYKDEKRECLWCGSKFIPENKWQKTCSDSCYSAYYYD